MARFKDVNCCQNASLEVLATCYRAQCFSVARDLSRRLGLPDGKWSVAFQSRLGRAKWIEPYTEARLEALAQQGAKKLLVMCPAFVADCIETLEEIGDLSEVVPTEHKAYIAKLVQGELARCASLFFRG